MNASGLTKKLDAGEMISGDSDDILIGKGLAKYLEMEVGDTLSLLGMGYQGASANGNFRVAGIIRFGTDEMSGNLLFMPYSKACEHFGAEGIVTSVNVYLDNINKLDQAKSSLVQSLNDENVSIYTWEEMMPELVQAFQADAGGNVIFLFVLYMVIGFGILGTVLMMTSERMYEYGVVVSVGMRRIKLIIITLFESVLDGGYWNHLWRRRGLPDHALLPSKPNQTFRSNCRCNGRIRF